MAEPPNVKLTAVFEPCEEGGFHAFIREIPGIHTQGETIGETQANLTDALGRYLLDGLEDNSRGSR
jgi:predicted RNase H-like HicB family nuclease